MIVFQVALESTGRRSMAPLTHPLLHDALILRLRAASVSARSHASISDAMTQPAGGANRRRADRSGDERRVEGGEWGVGSEEWGVDLVLVARQ